jgi:cytochrome c
VLIAYSDCHSCHAVDKRINGPAFKDIAKRYPVQDQYIALLAKRIIIGGSGAWGYSVMTPHSDLKEEDAKTMVKFILSLKE